MPFQSEPVVLEERVRSQLETIGRSQSLPAGFVIRAKIVLLSAAGFSYAVIADKLDVTTRTVGKWKLLRVQPNRFVFWLYRKQQRPALGARPGKYVEHGEQAQRSNGGPIACFDRQVVRNAG